MVDGPRENGRDEIDVEDGIDAVYTWVDSDDPFWRRQMRESLAEIGQSDEAIDADLRRFRNHDELRYSLRSLEKFAPWVRRIYLVTAGQTPSWLNTAAPRLHVVHHEAIFPDQECLPTFNSHAIELNLHRIPGLSRRFLYFNDDLFLGRSCAEADFFRAGTAVVYFEKIRLDKDLQPDQPTDRACALTRDRVAAALGVEKLSKMPAHTPQLYDTHMISELENRLPGNFARTSVSRFRTADDLVLRIAHATLAMARGQHRQVLDWGSDDYAFLRLQGNPLARLRDLMFIRRSKPRFFCLNDNLPPGWRGALLTRFTKRFLAHYFSEPCTFETSGADV